MRRPHRTGGLITLHVGVLTKILALTTPECKARLQSLSRMRSGRNARRRGRGWSRAALPPMLTAPTQWARGWLRMCGGPQPHDVHPVGHGIRYACAAPRTSPFTRRPLANTVTKFAQHGPLRGVSVKKSALLAQKHCFWHVLRVLGESFPAWATPTPNRENFVPFPPPTRRAGRKKSRTNTPPHPNNAPLSKFRMQFDCLNFQ